MDKKIFFFFYNFTTTHKRFCVAANFIDQICPFVFITIFASFFVYLTYSGLFHKLVLFLCVPLVTLIISRILRHTIKRPRPCQTFKLEGRHSQKGSFSFPSNHAASSSVIAFGCIYISTPIGIVVLGLAVITSLSRLFTGAHYPLDVCAGFLLGAFIAAVGFVGLPIVI